MEWSELRERHRRGESISTLAKEYGLTRNTVRKYLAVDKPPTYPKREVPTSLLDPHKDYIRGRLAECDLSVKRLLVEIRQQGYAGGYTILKDFVLPIKKDRAVRAEIRFETPAGEQGQVDWIDLGRHSMDGEAVHLNCFVLVLGYSRAAYIEFTDNVRTETFLQCHLNAFQYLGGFPRTLLYDNTKNVVLRRDLIASRSTFNPLFADFSSALGFTPRLCRPGINGAKTKGKVENFIKFVQKDFFIGCRFDSLNDINAQAVAWLATANARVHGTTHEVPVERLGLEGLTPLDPMRPYIVVQIEKRKVTSDCFVSYRGSKYSVPWQYAGRECQLHLRFGHFDVMIDGEAVTRHEVVPGRRTVRVKEHFAGLQKLKRDINLEKHQKRMGVVFDPIRVNAPKVETRELAYYEKFAEERRR